MPSKTIPKLPITCLKTADYKNTEQVVKGKNTIIDFWTTRCTQCPDALDKLDQMAKDPKYKDVQFISIVCDKLDGARTIIEQDKDLRWQNVNHYFMNTQDKETAKSILGFQQVPFYVVMDEHGAITQSGNGRQVDFEVIPGVHVSEDDDSEHDTSTEEEEEAERDHDNDVVDDDDARKKAFIRRNEFSSLEFELEDSQEEDSLGTQLDDEESEGLHASQTEERVIDDSIFDFDDFWKARRMKQLVGIG